VESPAPQVRQYTLKAILSLPLDKLDVSKRDISAIQQIKDEDPQSYNQVLAKKICDKWGCHEQVLEEESQGVQLFPQGATRKVLHQADLANTFTTVELVQDGDDDAFYFRTLENSGVKLNEPQLQATRHLDGPALVLAGAGSGKTRVLSSRAGYLMSVHSIHPSQILLLTFTKKAADEMKERIASLPGSSQNRAKGVRTGTYHSIFLALLRSTGDRRAILSNEKRKHIYLKNIMRDKNVREDYEPESLLSILSHYKNSMVSVEGLPSQTPAEQEVKDILRAYEKVKKQEGYMDFDDILLDAYFLLQEETQLRQRVQQQYAYVLCDEWQDTNPIQYELVKMIASPHNHLFVVGDDDQTIYEFNGADSSIILNFSKHYPQTKTYKLDINYRSTTSIVGLANQVISFNQKRHYKSLKAMKDDESGASFIRPNNPNDEAERIVQNILSDVQEGRRPYKDFAILYRANSNNRAIFDQLVLQDVPFVTYGDANTFYEHAIVKPVIDHMRLAQDSFNMDAVRSILPTLYLNRERTSDFIMKKAKSESDKPLLFHALDLPQLKGYQQKQVRERIQLLKRLEKMKPVQAVREIRTFYDKYLDAQEQRNGTMHREMIQETLAEIESSAIHYDSIPEFLKFIDEIIEKNKEMEKLRKDPAANYVKLMTIHKSKGLEYPVVYLIGASETVLPHRSALDADEKKDMQIQTSNLADAALEGERRLAYVAITRAAEELYISSPSVYHEKRVPVSRFIMDVFSDQPYKEDKSMKQSKSGAQRDNKKTADSKASILVWDCSSETCIAWKRIETYEETLLEAVECPLCGEEMRQGVREVVEK